MSKGTSLCSRGHASACRNIFDRNRISKCQNGQVCAREDMPVTAGIYSTKIIGMSKGTSLCSRGHASACRNIVDRNRISKCRKGQVCVCEEMPKFAGIYSTEIGHRNVERD